MDDKLLQCFALATSLASAVAAVLAFSQSGWRSTVRATLLVLGTSSVAYLFLLPERQSSAPQPQQALCAAIPQPTGGRTGRSWEADTPNRRLAAAIPTFADASLDRFSHQMTSSLSATPVPCLPSVRPAEPADMPNNSVALSLISSAATPQPLPHRYPSVYVPAEVVECPHCHTPFSSSGNAQGVTCPACGQAVDLVPSGGYYTIHCCCGNWLRSPFPTAADGVAGVPMPIPYFCPRCRARGSIPRPANGRE